MWSLKSLGVEPTAYGAMLSSVLLTKLLPDLCLIVSRKVSTTDLDMDSLLQTFEEELVARKRAVNPHTQVRHMQDRRTQDRGKHSASALFLEFRKQGLE